MKRRTPLLLFALLCLLAMPAGAQGQHTYLMRVIDHVDATAGMPVDIPIFLQNTGTGAVTLSLAIQQPPAGGFLLDSLSAVQVIQPGEIGVAMLHFMATAEGNFQCLLTATDGSITDSVTLTVTVHAGPGPFVLLPPFQEVSANLGVSVQIPVTVQNLDSSPHTVQYSLHGDMEFTTTGMNTVTIPAQGSETILIDFHSSVEGRFSTMLRVTDGTYSDSALIAVVAFDQPYTWVLPFLDEIETMAGMEAAVPVMVINNGTTPVTLQLALNGSSVFTLDPSSQQITLQPGMGADAKVSVLSMTPGTFTTMLTVTDGNRTDSLELRAIVHRGPGNFMFVQDYHEVMLKENESTSIAFRVQNLVGSTHSLNVTMTGDPIFTLAGSSPVTLDPNASVLIPVDIAGAARGVYQAEVMISDGTESDVARIVAYVGNGGHGGGSEFTLSYEGRAEVMIFETAENTTLTKDVTIENISGAELTLHFDLATSGGFSIASSSMTLATGATGTLPVTFDNSYGGFSDGMLMIEGGSQVSPVILIGMTLPFQEKDGVRITNALDFGMVDSNQTSCLEAVIENRTTNAIVVNSATLSGFSGAFTLAATNFPFTVPANGNAAIEVCFRPVQVNQVENEVLTISYTNPSATPNAQSANVDLTGRSTTGIRFPGDSCGIVGWYVNTISAPLDGQSEATIELFNITPAPLTIDNAVWEDGNDDGIYSLQTSLPILIQPHTPAVPNSGKADITVRYAPTSQSSSVGVEDIATLRLESAATSFPATMWLTLVGLPTTPAPNSGTVVLFPKDHRIPAIELGEVESSSSRMLEFENNLQVPVTIGNFSLSSSERFEITNAEDYPRTVAPGETAVLMLRSKGTIPGRATDVLTMQGSHDHLNSRFDLISGTGLTDVDDVPGLPGSFTASLSPNPSTDRVQVTLSERLANGHIEVLDMLGRVVALREGAVSTWSWDGTVDGVPARSGTYYIRISGVTETGARVSITKNALILR